jgi:hypothetical protein
MNLEARALMELMWDSDSEDNLEELMLYMMSDSEHSDGDEENIQEVLRLRDPPAPRTRTRRTPQRRPDGPGRFNLSQKSDDWCTRMLRFNKTEVNGSISAASSTAY